MNLTIYTNYYCEKLKMKQIHDCFLKLGIFSIICLVSDASVLYHTYLSSLHFPYVNF